MTDHVVLLRGVNVGGGRKLAMEDLKRLASDIGLQRARTYIASGNLVVGGWRGADAGLEAMLEGEAEARLQLKTSFFVRNAKDWRALVDGNPFPEEAEERPSKLVAMLVRETPTKSQLATLRAAITGRERVEAGERVLYIDFPDGQGASTLDRDWARTRQAPLGTARNWNTVLKLAEMVGA